MPLDAWGFDAITGSMAVPAISARKGGEPIVCLTAYI